MNEKKRQEQATDLFKFLYELSKESYQNELRRQSQIIDQSRTIQTVFAMISIALVTIIPWLKDILGDRTRLIILVTVFYFVVFALLISTLIIAGLVQHRRILQTLPDIDILEKTMNENFHKFLNDDTKEKFKIDELAIIQRDLSKDNDFKVKLINAANVALIITVSLLFLFAYKYPLAFFK